MSTIYTFHNEADIAGVADADQFLVYDASAGRTRSVTALGLAAVQGGALVAAGSTITLTAAAHNGRTIALDTAAGSIVILPAATGAGTLIKCLVTVLATSNSHVIKASTGTTNEMRGYVIQDSDTATAPNIWWAADNDDTITLNRTTTGLADQGEYFELVDAVSGHWFVRGYSSASGTEATPFSATV